MDSLEQQLTSTLKDLRPKLEELEETRKHLRKKIKTYNINTLAILLIVGLLVYLLIRFTQSSIWIYVVIGILTITGLIIYYSKCIGNMSGTLENDFHENITTKIVSGLLGDTTEFNSKVSLDLGDYYNSKIYGTGVDRTNGSNYISGVCGKTKLRFSNLHTEYKTVTQTKNGTRTEWHTIFKGVFMAMEPNKNFEAETYILPDEVEKLLGGLGRWVQRNTQKFRGELIYLEDPEFEKNYMVYSTDPVEARYLITPSMQHRLVELKKHFRNANICISFVNNKLYCSISSLGQIFYWHSKSNFTEEKTLTQYTNNLLRLLKVVEILDLNTRIWGK